MVLARRSTHKQYVLAARPTPAGSDTNKIVPTATPFAESFETEPAGINAFTLLHSDTEPDGANAIARMLTAVLSPTPVTLMTDDALADPAIKVVGENDEKPLTYNIDMVATGTYAVERDGFNRSKQIV